jgi:hypothetical protein
MQKLNILFIGDIVSRLGRQAVIQNLARIKKTEQIDLVVANGENTTNGRGINLQHYQELINAGVDYFTSGEHIYRDKSIIKEIDSLNICVPANFYPNLPGKRLLEIDLGQKGKVYVLSLLGTVFINQQVKNPFHTIDQILEDLNSKNVIIDFHAEATSEKAIMKNYLDGKVLAVIGTHTHVQTADEQITEKGTAFITDVGMCGSNNSSIGVKYKIVEDRLVKGIKAPFEWEKEGSYILNAVILRIDIDNEIAKNITRVSFKYR